MATKLGKEIIRRIFSSMETYSISHNNAQNVQIGQIIKTIEEKMNRGMEAIQSNVEQMINNKLSNLSQESNQQPTNQQRSYSTAVGNTKSGAVKDFRTIMLVNKNEEIAEEMDRISRAKNIITHGKCEEGAAIDRSFAEDLIKELQIGPPAISTLERIGQIKEGENGLTQKRPIKLTLKSKEDQEKILNNLRNLKGKLLYKGISITTA